jgi:hypothetical protein
MIIRKWYWLWYVLPLTWRPWDSASIATRSSSAVSPVMVSASPSGNADSTAFVRCTACALLNVPENGSEPAVHSTASSVYISAIAALSARFSAAKKSRATCLFSSR